MSERSDRQLLEKQFQELLQAEKAHMPHAAAPPKKRRPEPPKLVRDVAKQRNVDLRTAAFVLAVQRVVRAALSRRTLHKPPEIG